MDKDFIVMMAIVNDTIITIGLVFNTLKKLEYGTQAALMNCV